LRRPDTPGKYHLCRGTGTLCKSSPWRNRPPNHAGKQRPPTDTFGTEIKGTPGKEPTISGRFSPRAWGWSGLVSSRVGNPMWASLAFTCSACRVWVLRPLPGKRRTCALCCPNQLVWARCVFVWTSGWLGSGRHLASWPMPWSIPVWQNSPGGFCQDLIFVKLTWPTLIVIWPPAGPRDPLCLFLRLHPHLHALRSVDQHLGRLPVV
jgi:hypothetical protein